MQTELRRVGITVARRLQGAGGAIAGQLAGWVFRLMRLIDPDRLARVAGRTMRHVGPWLPEHSVGRANLAAAFPDKSAAEIEEILLAVWENLGRVGAEFSHLDRLWDYDPLLRTPSRIVDSDDNLERFCRLRDDGKPALIFTAHLANWELPALAAAAHGLPTAILYRRPNIGAIAEAIVKLRSISMGTLIPTTPDALFKAAAALEGGMHVAMLVDQHFQRGVDVNFFGRPCKVNPTIARLARHFDCPIHGTRTVRLPNNRFQVELTEAVPPVRNADGQIDVTGTMQAITSVIEGWVREHPEQWLWLHRRWR
jgi:KDO2-lipid IV(A) lauroyltransferase